MIEARDSLEVSTPVPLHDHIAGLPPLRYGTMFRRTLRDNLGSILSWGAGYSVLIVLVVLLYPILEERGTLINVISGFGLFDVVAENYAIDINGLASFAGYLAFEALGWAPTVLSIFLVPQAIAVSLGEEKRGTIDLLMSTPTPRWLLLSEKSLAVLVSLMGILGIMLFSIMVSVRISPEAHLTFGYALQGVFHIIPISSVIFSVTLLFSVTLRDPRVVGGLAALFVIGSFFLRSLADSTGSDVLEGLRFLSIYGYYSSSRALLEGIQWRDDVMLLAISGIVFLMATWRYQRRDL